MGSPLASAYPTLTYQAAAFPAWGVGGMAQLFAAFVVPVGPRLEATRGDACTSAVENATI